MLILRDRINGFNTEIDRFGYCFGTADFKEGTTAFLRKIAKRSLRELNYKCKEFFQTESSSH